MLKRDGGIARGNSIRTADTQEKDSASVLRQLFFGFSESYKKKKKPIFSKEVKDHILTIPTLSENRREDYLYKGNEHAFLSHRGIDTKSLLMVPLQRMMNDLYGYKFFLDCESVNEQSRSEVPNKEDVIRGALWRCPVVIIFISRRFH